MERRGQHDWLSVDRRVEVISGRLEPELLRAPLTPAFGALEASADKIGTIAYDENGRNDTFGHGRLNIFRALQTAGVSVSTTPRNASLRVGP